MAKDLAIGHFGATLAGNSPSYVLFIIHMKKTAPDPPNCWKLSSLPNVVESFESRGEVI